MAIDLNLVPFVDFLSALIGFLVCTAAWVQLTQLDTVQQVNDVPGEPPPTTAVFLHATTVSVQPPAGPSVPVEATVDALATALRAAGGEALTLHIDDDVPYASLVLGLDAAKQAGFEHPSIAGGD